MSVKSRLPQAFGDEDDAEYVRLMRQSGALRTGFAPDREATVSAAQNWALGE